MSIIEEAVRKSAERRNRAHATPATVPSRAPTRRVAATPVDTTHALRFATISLNPDVLAENFVLPQVTDTAAQRAYKILRTRLLRRLETNQWHSFAMTGVTSGEGKTLTAINLAIAMAQDVNTWVFLVDLDLQRPRVAEYLGLTNAGGRRGLSDFLVGDATLESIAYSPAGIERLAVIPNFQALAHSSELLHSPRMSDLMQMLDAETPRRILIFDMPPMLAADDVLAFAPQLDGLLLVVAEGTTSRDQLRAAKEVLAEMNLLGVVLNRSAERNDRAYYSYSKQ
jgi:capsular exopolysaccharide synthesis family protein